MRTVPDVSPLGLAPPSSTATSGAMSGSTSRWGIRPMVWAVVPLALYRQKVVILMASPSGK